MRVLVLGSGGREHALCWKLAQDHEVHAAPGNPGIQTLAELHAVRIDDLEGLTALAKSLQPDLIVVGPENPLVDGLADRLRAGGHGVLGPGAAGAQLEGSKAFSKAVMARAGIPTAAFHTCTSAEQAHEAARAMFDAGMHVAVKASGNALGKGVVVAETLEDALEAIDEMMVARVFGDAGATVVVEERLIGREFSLLSLCSGTHFWSFPIAQDYKRIFDGDRGPNTGGMGTYSPVPSIPASAIAQTEVEMVAPLLDHLQAEGIDYRGILFTGVMLTASGPKCLEYNVRFGDPETQSVMMRMGSGLGEALRAAALGKPILAPAVLERAAVTVVLANAGYPGSLAGKPALTLPDSLEPEVVIFHAGTSLIDGVLTATGGRVLGVSAAAPTLDEARAKAYRAAEAVQFEGKQYRSDIGIQIT